MITSLPPFITSILFFHRNKDLDQWPSLRCHSYLAIPSDVMAAHLTSGIDLHRIVSSCPTCLMYVDYGRNIRCHDELPSLRIPPTRTKFVYFVNTRRFNQSSGHWITLLLFKKSVLLCDGLNYAITRSDVMRNIRRFCRLNNCKLVCMQFRCQQEHSSNCGYISLAFVAKYHSLSLRGLHAMQSLFRRHSIRSNESLLLAFAQKHFSFQI